MLIQLYSMLSFLIFFVKNYQYFKCLIPYFDNFFILFVEMNKIGTITVSVFQSINKNNTAFKIETDNKDIEQISYVIEDALNAF